MHMIYTQFDLMNIQLGLRCLCKHICGLKSACRCYTLLVGSHIRYSCLPFPQWILPFLLSRKKTAVQKLSAYSSWMCVCVCLLFPFITPEAAAGRNHLIPSLHGGGHSKERCLQGKCLKSTQTYPDTLDNKHVATISVPSPQYTGSTGHETLWGVWCYCPLLAKGGTATFPAKVNNLLMNKQHDHKLQFACIHVTLGFSNYSVY